MPMLGMAQETGKLIRWLKAEGDTVAKGEPLIEVKARRDGEAVEVTVADNGCGIAAEDAGRLFQPYFTTKKHGTGLGLFVTRKLIEEHAGTVTFETSPSRGTLFRVRVPAADLSRSAP